MASGWYSWLRISNFFLSERTIKTLPWVYWGLKAADYWPIGKPRPPLVTVAPSDKQLFWQLQCENVVPRCFCTILDTEGHQMGIKYPMEWFIKYRKINRWVTQSEGLQITMKAGEVSYYGQSSRSRMTTCRINTVHVSPGTIKWMYI